MPIVVTLTTLLKLGIPVANACVAEFERRVAELEEALEEGEQERERLRSQLARLKSQMMTEQVRCHA